MDSHRKVNSGRMNFNIAITDLRCWQDAIYMASPDFFKKEACAILLDPVPTHCGTDVQGIYELPFGYPDWVFECVNVKSPGKYQVVLTTRFGYEVLEAKGSKDFISVQFDQEDRHDVDPARRVDTSVGHSFAEMFVKDFNEWPSSRFTVPYIRHPSWGWLYSKDRDAMVLVRYELDDEECEGKCVTHTVTEEMWISARETYRHYSAIRESGNNRWSHGSVNADSADYISWLGRFRNIDLYVVNGVITALTPDDTGTVICEHKLQYDRNSLNPDWYWEAMLRLNSMDRTGRFVLPQYVSPK